MKKYLLYVILFFCTIQQFHSQESLEDGVVAFNLPVRNSLKFNQYAINPTFSFVREQNRYISFSNKREWVQFDDAPQTYLFSYSGRFRENMGIGVGLFQQNYGVLTTFGGLLNYAYNAVLNNDSNLTFALNLGFYKSGINEGNVVTNFPDSSLDNIPSNNIITINPGINYGTDFFDFGLSVNNLVSYNLKTSKVIEDNPEQSIQGHIMYTGYVNSSGFFDESKFSTLVRSEFKKDVTVISGIVMLTVPKGIWAQAGYNSLYGFSAGIGLNISTQIALEYNYEKAIGNMAGFGSSHDITLAYKFKNKYRYDYSGDDEEAAFIIPEKKTKRVVAKRKGTTITKADREAIAEAKAKERAEALANAKAKADAEAEETVQAKLEAEAKTKMEAVTKAKADEEARIKLAEAARIKAEEEAKAKLIAAQNRAKLEAAAKAKADEEAQIKLADAARIKAEEEARAKLIEAENKATLEAAAKAKADEEARITLAEAERIKAEEETKAKLVEAENRAKLEAAAKAKADEEAQIKLAEATRIKEDEESRIKTEEAREALIGQVDLDDVSVEASGGGKTGMMQDLVKLTTDSNIEQQKLLAKLGESVASKEQDLKDLKEENDLSEQGIFKAPRAFKSVSAENAALESLKMELDATIKSQDIKISELEKLYNERLIEVSNKKDSVNASYLITIQTLKSEQLQAIESKTNLISTLEKIKLATEVERKRRIKRAAYDNEQDRYLKDRAALKQIQQFTPESPVPLKVEDFDFGEERSNNIQIVKDVKNVESGYYIVLAVHSDIAKRDDFLTKVVSLGQANINFFYDVNTSRYFIYYEKFDDIEDAKQALQSKGNAPYNNKMSVVKIEN
jgi:type IX secretion system PorP/SprF family membrane protein